MALINRKVFPYLLSILLILAAFGTAFVGFLAFKNLNKIIASLEEEADPQSDLFQLNQIALDLDQMEMSIERYVYSEDSSYLNDFGNYTGQILQRLDSLRGDDLEKNHLLDSVHYLVLDKSTVLQQVSRLDFQSFSSVFGDIDLATNKGLEDAKSGNFIRRLFPNQQSKKEYEAMFNKRLEAIAKAAEKEAYNQKFKEFTLRRDHEVIESRIQKLLALLESKQLLLIQNNALLAQDRAKYTSNYVTLFGIFVPVVLLLTLTTFFLYAGRTQKYNESLNQARKNAIDLAHEKERFLASMSHEIRTPMNAISGFTKILLEDDLTPKQKEQLTIIDKSTEHLNHILNDVLDFSKLKSGHLKLVNKPFNPKDTIMHCISLLEEKAKEKNIALTFEIVKFPEVVKGDPYRLLQILLNLTSNAIKFTEEGSVTIRLSSKKQNVSEEILYFDVVDTGIGITESKQNLVFNDFEQLETGMANKGTGLGLAITKRLVEFHGGEISLRSELGTGSTFSFFIPYDLPQESSLANEPIPSTEEKLGSRHVLIADDEAFNRMLLEEIFEKNGISFESVVNGSEALDALRSRPFDMAFLDFKMPMMNGPEVIRQIRSETGVNAKIPLFGLTATVLEKDFITAHEAGATEIIRKPFDPKDLLSLVKGQDKNEGQAMAYSLEGILKMGDLEFTKDLIQTYISSVDESLKQFDTHCQNEEWEDAADQLHKILGPTRHFKNARLVSLLKDQELSLRDRVPISTESREEIKSRCYGMNKSLRIDLQEMSDNT